MHSLGCALFALRTWPPCSASSCRSLTRLLQLSVSKSDGNECEIFQLFASIHADFSVQACRLLLSSRLNKVYSKLTNGRQHPIHGWVRQRCRASSSKAKIRKKEGFPGCFDASGRAGWRTDTRQQNLLPTARVSHRVALENFMHVIYVDLTI